jgi:hypothetical protein
MRSCVWAEVATTTFVHAHRQMTVFGGRRDLEPAARQRLPSFLKPHHAPAFGFKAPQDRCSRSGPRPTSTCIPRADLAAQPEARPPPASVQDGTWHVGIAPLIQVDRRRVREAEQRRHVMGVDEFIDVD